jgi:hypothetical protein
MDSPNTSPLLRVEFVDHYLYANGKRVVGKMTGPASGVVTALASCDRQARALSKMLAEAARQSSPQHPRQTPDHPA